MEKKKKILWIHGFCGRPNNENIEYMKSLYSQYDIYAIEVDHHAKTSVDKINAFIRDNDVSIVAGTSLGGFYTLCAVFDGPKLVVNPVIEPIEEMKQFLGINTYKPGRPDGQNEFEFTEDMLKEFGELHLQPLDKTICHHTAHDKVLGEDIKSKYQETFYFLMEIDKKVLPGHSLTKKYIKEVLDTTFEKMLLGIHFGYDDMYSHYGMDYLDVPRELWEALKVPYCLKKNLNCKKVLHEIEETLCAMEKGAARHMTDSLDYREIKKSKVARILLEQRKLVLCWMFTDTEETFLQFKEINSRLETLTNLMKKKLSSLYKYWLENEDGPWKNDCQVVGYIKTDCDTDNIPSDETGSMFGTMLAMIEQYGGNELLHIEFSGSPDRNGDEWFSQFQKEKPCWWFYVNPAPYGNFLECRAFKNLREKSLFAPQDILRISTFWCDAYVVHQCIIDKDGNIS